MSFLWRLFRAPPPADDYESVLAALASDIAQRQSALAALRARERYASTLVTLYALAAWAVYLAVWYFGFVASGAGVRGIERAVRALPVVVGPILERVDGRADTSTQDPLHPRIVQIWYNRKGNAEGAAFPFLSSLAFVPVLVPEWRRHRVKNPPVPPQTAARQGRGDQEEDQLLLDARAARALRRGVRAELAVAVAPSGGQTPQRPGPASALSVSQNGRPGAASPSSAPSSAQQQQNQPRQTQQQPAQRKWFDALADLLVGAEDAARSGRAEVRADLRAVLCAQWARARGGVGGCAIHLPEMWALQPLRAQPARARGRCVAVGVSVGVYVCGWGVVGVERARAGLAAWGDVACFADVADGRAGGRDDDGRGRGVVRAPARARHSERAAPVGAGARPRGGGGGWGKRGEGGDGGDSDGDS
ncbi:hypothetical protein B0H17DRAFT_1177522 [Mycena rosella]|uniref:Uncharacterized protein n=1 Tax=Mycena rosella TaxID=1033263 RepID=A0AAD7DS63_MYCRO|nr:hypothetical protein B0H17DRAFT_1177522 [Mycena rosella]